MGAYSKPVVVFHREKLRFQITKTIAKEKRRPSYAYCIANSIIALFISKGNQTNQDHRGAHDAAQY